MAALDGSPNQSPWNTPYTRRPTIADFNNAQKIDDPNASPPNPQTDPNAGEENTVKFCIVAMATMIPSAEVSVTAGSSPTISNVLSPVDAVNGNAAAFTLTRVGAGHYKIETTTGTTALPALVGQPEAWINALLGATESGIGATYITGPLGHPAIEINVTVGGALADANFTVRFR